MRKGSSSLNAKTSHGVPARGATTRIEPVRLDVRDHHLWVRYGIAVVAVAAGFLLRAALSAQVGEGLPTYITFYPAVTAAALLAGLGPGLLATALTLAVVDYWIVSPHTFFWDGDLVEITSMVLFSAMGVFISLLAEFYRRARQKTAEYERELAVRESQEELRRQREWLRVTLSSIGDAVVASDTAGRITFLNPTAEQLTGWTEKEVLGRPVHSVVRLVDEQTHAPAEDLVARVLCEQRVVLLANHTALITRDGREIPVEDSAAPIKESADTVCGVVVVLHDVTEKRRALDAFRQTAEQHRLALDAGNLGTWDYNFATGDVFWDERCRTLFGAAQGDRIDYASALGTIHEADRQDVDRAVQAALTPDSSGRYAREYRVVWPDGSVHWVAAKGQAYFQGEGSQREPVRLIGTAQDISERIQTEKALTFLAQCGRAPDEDFFQSLTQHLAENLGMDFVCIGRLAGDGLTVQTVAVFFEGKVRGNMSYALKDTSCGEVVGQAVCSFPSEVRHRFPKDVVLQDMRAESYVGVTLWSYTGQPIGVIAVIGRRSLAKPHLAESLLQLVAGRAAGELERRLAEEALNRALTETTQRHSEVSALLKGSRAVLQHRGFAPAAKAIFDACKELIGATVGYVALVSDDGTQHHLLFLDTGNRPCTVDPALPMPIRGLRAEACRAGTAVYQNGFANSPWSQLLPPGHVAFDSALFAPLIVEGKALGLFALAEKPGGFTDNDARLASAFADLAALALRNSRTLELLEHSEERFRSVAQTANDAIVTADVRGNVVFWNRAAENIFGYRAEDIVGQPLLQIVPESMRAAHQQAFTRVFSEDGARPIRTSFEVPGRKKDGTEIPLELSLAQWDSGEESFFTGIARDITERKRTEEALSRARADLERTVEQRTMELRATNAQLRMEIEAGQRKERDLSEAELRYRTVADFTYDWEYWKTPDGVLLYCSPSCERITGHTAAELVGDPGLLARIVHPEDRDHWQRHDREALAAPEGATIVFRIQRKDGGIRWIDHNCRPVLGNRGEPLGVRASNRDITARKQVEMEMQHLRQELARTSRITAATQLTAALAHELSQPLGAILCNAQAAEQYLSQAPPPLSEVREILSDIEADGQRARSVIQRLRALFQKSSPEPTAVQLNHVVQETIGLLHSELAIKGVSVQLDLEPTLPEVSGDYVELQQVVINLILNALDAMAGQEPGTRRLHIGTACGEPQSVRLSFRDSGTGLSADQLSHVGEPFFTTKPTGMGMGLAISRSILEAHGGRLWAENNPDCGAAFHLAIPVFSERSA